MVAPAPGTMPMMMPSTDERTNVPFTCADLGDRRQLGLDLAELAARVGEVKPCSSRDSTSPRP